MLFDRSTLILLLLTFLLHVLASPITDALTAAPNTNNNSLTIEPSSCKPATTEINDWRGLKFSTQPIPDLDVVTVSTNASAQIPDPEPLNVARGICIQHRHVRFFREVGWIRTPPYLIDDQDSDYYVVFGTDRNAKMKVWQGAATGSGSNKWNLMYDGSRTEGKEQMQWHFKGYEWKNREIMVEINLQPIEKEDQRTSGELALFSTNTFPKPDKIVEIF